MEPNKAGKLTVSQIGRLLADRNLEEKAINGLEACLQATVTICGADGKLHSNPDFKTRLGAITLIVSYTAGRPIERKEVIVHTTKTLEELRAQAKSSPELTRSIEGLLVDTKRGHVDG
jgi:hypothetical protein